MTKKDEQRILLGNTFPPSLIRRKVTVTPIQMSIAKAMLKSCGFASFWGHSNTINVANKILGVDVTPATERPALTLSEKNLPMLDGKEFDAVLVLSPTYIPGYRPAIGEEVGEDKITGWQCLYWRFE